jgi:beta-N-acetylhexosaminidase
MSTETPITRREFVIGTALGAGSLLLAACGAQETSPSPGATASSSVPTPSPSPGASPVESATPGPTPVVGALSLREKVARMLVFGFRGRDLADLDWVKHYIGNLGVGGVILFDRDQETGAARNVASSKQVSRLVSDIRALAPDREVIIAIDQEGGVVTRLAPKYGFPSVASQEAIGKDGDSAVQAWADGLVATLAGVGINLNFAPVVDLNVNPDNPAIGKLHRAFSADPAIVSRDAEIELEAHRAKGVRTALKHFPGLGSATANTDFGVADVTATWTETELDPYRDLLGLGLVDLVMVGHLVNGQIDGNAPASLSHSTVTELLRVHLGWDGVVVTDDMQAAAITETFGADDAVTLAIEAGCDLLLFANQQVYDPERVLRVINLVERLVGDGRISEARIDASVERLERLFGSSQSGAALRV